MQASLAPEANFLSSLSPRRPARVATCKSASEGVQMAVQHAEKTAVVLTRDGRADLLNADLARELRAIREPRAKLLM